MKIDLSGKTALVTGSTAGIGFAIARGLQEAGAAVVVNGRTTASVEAALARLGGTARGRAIDLGTAEGVQELAALEPAFDVVVNNLGIFEPIDFFATDDDGARGGHAPARRDPDAVGDLVQLAHAHLLGGPSRPVARCAAK